MQKPVKELCPALSCLILFALSTGVLPSFAGLPVRAVSLSQAQGSPGWLAGRILKEGLPCDNGILGNRALVF